MPIYAYRCAACGHAKDVLQKVSDPVLTRCPACGADAFAKQVTAAGFQLKGSGWYVTDFRGGNTGAAKDPAAGDKAAGQSGDPSKGASGEAAKPAPAAGSPAAAAPAAAPAPAAPPSGGSGSSSG